MVEVSATREVSSSVEITRDAKGDYKLVVKCYAEAGQEAAAARQAVAIIAQLRQEYGL